MSGEDVHERATYGKYRVVAKLGRGGMATVYLAVDQGPAGFNKLKVVKCLHPASGADSEEQLKMFLDEIRLTALLNHRNVVQAYEVGQEGDTYFLVMEYLEGQTFRAVQTRAARLEGGMPLGYKLRVLADVLNGLHHAHDLKHPDGGELNIVHRDVTPHNIFVTYDGGVKVVDFGIAKTALSSVDTRADVIKGKVPYMAPEQLKAGSVDRRTDVFQVGIMLWEAVTGERFWGSEGDLLILSRLTNNLIPEIDPTMPGMDAELARMCARALAYAPDDRYPTAEAFRRDIEAYIDRTGNRASAEEVGAYTARLFADKRSDIKRLIEENLKRAKAAGPGSFSGVPTLQTSIYPAADGTPSGLQLAGAGSMLGPPNGDSISVTRSAADGTASPATATVTSGTAHRKPVVVLGVVAAMGLAITLVLLTRSSPGTMGTLRGSPNPPAASSALPPSTPITLRLSAKPESAALFLDDAPLGNSPYTSQFARDKVSHRIRAEARGYARQSAVVTFDHDVTLDISLDRLAEPAASAQADAPVTSVTSAAPAVPVPAYPHGARPASAPKSEPKAPDAKAEAKPPPELPPKKEKLQLDNTDPWKP